MIKIGSHVSNNGLKMMIGSVEETIENNANCMMLYLGAPQNTFRKPVKDQNAKEALALAKEHGISRDDIIVHAPYIVNLANPDYEKRQYAISFLTKELEMVAECGLKYMVLHPGAHMKEGSNQGVRYIAEGINEILSSPKTLDTAILLETMAGKGTEVGRTFEEIKGIIDLVYDKSRVMVCLDTCHINDGGYDLVDNYDGVFKSFDEIIGLDKIKAIHLNDSKNPLDSHKDRHENIGFGEIGFTALHKVLTDPRFENVPKILETPYIEKSKLVSLSPYKKEIEMLKSGIFNPNLKEEILN